MRATSSGAAFAAASAAMIRGVDGASTVYALLADCLGLLGADPGGVLVRVGEQQVDLLAAASHKAEELELYQSQLHVGPCIEAIETGQRVGVAKAAELVDRWPELGGAMVQAGSAWSTPHRCAGTTACSVA